MQKQFPSKSIVARSIEIVQKMEKLNCLYMNTKLLLQFLNFYKKLGSTYKYLVEFIKYSERFPRSSSKIKTTYKLLKCSKFWGFIVEDGKWYSFTHSEHKTHAYWTFLGTVSATRLEQFHARKLKVQANLLIVHCWFWLLQLGVPCHKLNFLWLFSVQHKPSMWSCFIVPNLGWVCLHKNDPEIWR